MYVASDKMQGVGQHQTMREAVGILATYVVSRVVVQPAGDPSALQHPPTRPRETLTSEATLHIWQRQGAEAAYGSPTHPHFHCWRT